MTSKSETIVATVLVHRPGFIFEQVIRGIASQSIPPKALIVLDNGSPDAVTLHQLNDWMDASSVETTLLHNGVNLGVGAGHNFLIDSAERLYDPDWFWMLEHDTVADSDCLADLIAAVSVQSALAGRIAAAIPNFARAESERELLWPEDPALRLPATMWAERFTFNAILLSRAARNEVGKFREDLFVGGEDWDYSARLVDNGWLMIHRQRPTGIHPTRGDHRHGIRPSTGRQYYSVRSHVLLGATRIERLRRALRLGAGASRDITRPDSARFIAARLTAAWDGLSGRAGERDYWFMHSRGLHRGQG